MHESQALHRIKLGGTASTYETITVKKIIEIFFYILLDRGMQQNKPHTPTNTQCIEHKNYFRLNKSYGKK